MFLLPVILAMSAGSEPVAATEALTPSSFAPTYLAAAPAASAWMGDEFMMSYTYIELTYFSTDIDAIDETTDGYGARGSLGLFDFLFAFIGYSTEDVDFDGGSADTDSYELGVGGHLDIKPELHVVGEVSWVYDDLSEDTLEDLDESDSGFTAYAGLRWLVLPTDRGGLELNGGFRWIDREYALLSEDEVGAFEAGGRFHFLNHLSVGAGYQFLEDDARWNASLRFAF